MKDRVVEELHCDACGCAVNLGSLRHCKDCDQIFCSQSCKNSHICEFDLGAEFDFLAPDSLCNATIKTYDSLDGSIFVKACAV